MKRFILPLVVMGMCTTAQAGFDCTGSLSGVTLAPDGGLYMERFKNWNWLKLCNVHTEVNGVNPESCKAVYSLLLTAQTTQKEVTFWFKEGDCSKESQREWAYINTWYFGPKLK